MIVGSLLLLLAGVAMLIVGLALGQDTFLVGAIVASLFAAVCLYGASRRNTTDDAPAEQRGDHVKDDPDDRETDARLRSREASRDRARDRDRDRDRADDAPTTTMLRSRDDDRTQALESARSGRKTVDVDAQPDAAPTDEPSEVPMSSVEAAALMRMDAEVMVVDGRPRFHLGGCVHLVERDAESLPAYEAVELGFGACALCRPAQSLLREPTRR